MNRVLIFKEEIAELNDNFSVILTDSFRLEHLNSILKVKINDKLKVLVPNYGFYEGLISNISDNEIKINCTLENKLRPKSKINLFIGLSRPQTCKKVIEHATGLGVSSFNFFKANLSEKSYLTAKIFSEKKYEELINLGLSQSNYYYQRPELTVSKYLKKDLIKDEGQSFILSPFTDKTFNDFNLDFKSNINLAFGPERGWTKEEVEEFKSLGFKEVKISNSIQRVEIATFTTLGQLDLLRLTKA